MTICAIISSRIFILCIISLSTICSIHAYQGTKRIGSSGSFVQAKLSRQSISTYPSDHSRDSRHCNRLSLNAMSNRIRKDGYEQESRLYSISPITRPANLDLPPDYSMLQLGDVLSQRSVGHAAENAEYLRTRFPDLTEDKILKWLYKFPTLSVIETKDIVKAIALFEQEVPEVDLTYLIHQDTVGMEVLLSVLSTQSFLPQRQTIQQTMQLIIDPSTLIRRVPHILHERYWQRFTSHCLYLHNYLAFNQTDAVELIMRWPPILQVELDSTIKHYLQVLQDNKLPIKMKDFSEMITREPSILGHSDSFQKKVTHLIESYGQTWDLHYIVTSYPKIFLQEKHRLSTVYEGYMHYTKSQKAVDAAINEIPSILNYRPALIWDKACILASYLGSPDPTIVFEKASREIVCTPTFSSISKLRKLQKMFLESKQPGGNFHSVRGGIERNNIHQQQRQAYKQWSRSQYSYQNTGTSAFKTDEEEVKERQLRNDMLKTKIKSILASQETSFIKAKKVASIIYPHFLDNIAVSNEEYESDKDAIDKVLQSYYLQRPRPSHTITNSDNSTTMTSAHHPSDALFPQDDQLDHELIMGKASDRSEEGDWRMMTTNKQAFVPLSKEEFHERVSRINGKLQSVDIKRLVLVNIDNFARRFSYFKELTTAWIDAFNPVIAHAVLSANPQLLHKKPAAVSSFMKLLYGMILTSMHQIEPNNFTILDSEMSMFQPGVLYHALYRFFYKAPTIIRKDIPFITSQLQSLQNLDISLPIITLFAPRLMTESIPRTHFRVQFWRKLLAYEAKGASMQDVWQLLGVADAEKNIQEYLLDADSKPLVELALLSPLSKLFRLVFIRNRANPKDSSIWKRDLREILDANTEQFFTSFLLKDEIHDEKMTKKTAQEYIKFMQESIAKLKQHFPFISLANTELDQRLPPDGPSMDIVRSYEGHFTECLNNAKMEDRVGLDSFLNAMLMPKAHK